MNNDERSKQVEIEIWLEHISESVQPARKLLMCSNIFHRDITHTVRVVWIV